MSEHAPILGEISKDIGNNATEEKKTFLNGVKPFRKYSVEQIRELVLMIKVQSKGKLSFSKISEMCGWNKSRLSQMLTNWENPKYVSSKETRQDQIYNKLKEVLAGC